MSGNVAEWVWDIYAPYTGDVRDPKGPEDGEERSIRGGSFIDLEQQVRACTRDQANASLQNGQLGFRIVRGARKKTLDQ